MLFFLPEIILLITGFSVLSFDLLKKDPARNRLAQITLVGLALGCLAIFLPVLIRFNFSLLVLYGPLSFFDNFYWVDLFAIFFKLFFLVLGVFIVMLNHDYYGSQVKKNEGEFYFLLCASLLGLILMVSSPNLLLIYLGLELAGQTAYLLAGWQKNALRSGEAAIKYFLFGAVSSAVFLYGVSLFYGQAATFDLSQVNIQVFASPLYLVSVLFMVIGFGFKIAMAPLQFWCPDVYEGAPTPVTAYLSIGPKAAGFAALIRLMMLLRLDFSLLFAGLAVLTMTWGNLVALKQNNVKRLFAYSSIAQAGNIMIGLVSPVFGLQGVSFYLLAYALANLGVFAIIILLSLDKGNEDLMVFSGLARRAPGITAALTLFLLSLVGIPPLAGFIGKFLIFRAALGGGFLWLAVVGIINAVISVYFYLNIVRIMYFNGGADPPLPVPLLVNIVVYLCLGATLLLGLFPGLLLW